MIPLLLRDIARNVESTPGQRLRRWPGLDPALWFPLTLRGAQPYTSRWPGARKKSASPRRRGTAGPTLGMSTRSSAGSGRAGRGRGAAGKQPLGARARTHRGRGAGDRVDFVKTSAIKHDTKDAASATCQQPPPPPCVCSPGCGPPESPRALIAWIHTGPGALVQG